MNLTQLLSILTARSKTVLTIFALVIGSSLLVSVLIPKKYLASTDVVIDLKPDPVNGSLASGMMIRPYLKTQADIVGSERLRLMVVDRFSLNANPAYLSNMPASAPEASARQYAADHLARNLKVVPSRESTMLTISYRSTNPSASAEIANAFARAFIETNIEMRTIPATQRRDWFAKQAVELRAKLDSTQKSLGDFQRKNNIVSADESRDVSTQRLESLSASLTQASDQASDLTQKTSQARDAIDNNSSQTIPEVIASTSVQALRAEQSRLRSAYGQQLAVYGKSHPQMRSLGNELWAISNRIGDEIQTIVAGLEKSRDSAIARSERIQEELAAHQSSVLAAKNYREELSLLQRDIENARRAYDSVQEQLSQSNLQSASTYANLFVLSPALTPSRPSSPNMLINILAAIVVGTVLAIGISLLLEFRHRRIHSGVDMTQATGRPVLGQLSQAFGTNKSGAVPQP